MISPSLWVAVLLLPIAFLTNAFINLRKNVQAAKASGLPYVIVPVYSYNRLFMILGGHLVAASDKWLPKASPDSWRYLNRATWPWLLRHEPFARLGTDTFLTVAPGGIIMFTADADVITRVTTRWTDFPKPTFLYRIVDIYGPNIISSEGAAWRHHRKLTSPAFSEKNNRLVWSETLSQTQAMLASWVGSGDGRKTVRSVNRDAMRLSLNVISRAGFGQKMEMPEEGEVAEQQSPPEGHTMTFAYSLSYLLDHLLYVMILPKWVLKKLPSPVLNKSFEAYEEWRKYIREMIAEKKSAVQAGDAESLTVDLLGQLVKGQEEGSKDAALTDSEVMGNSFLFIIAGHETTAGSIHALIMLLAIHPHVQKQVQKELEGIFQGRPISKWDYEQHLPRLFTGMLGAVMNEGLRMLCPVFTVPKTVSSAPQQLTVDGKEATVPPKTIIKLCVSSVHRNPRYWPHGPPKDPRKPFFPPASVDSDLEEFRPERWIDNSASAGAGTSPSLFTPTKGAYIPFSDGHRACLGKRFAQVEVLAALAAIFSEYSVELAVDEWASDAEVDRMTKEEKRVVWRKAEEKANWIWQNKMSIIVTLQLRGAHVPMRFVKKGKERFWDV